MAQRRSGSNPTQYRDWRRMVLMGISIIIILSMVLSLFASFFQ